MTVGRICCREVILAEPHESVRTAAQRMREHNVGSLVVLDADRRPAGILTDRDLALRVVAEGRPPDAWRVDEVMTERVATVPEQTPIEDALEEMRRHGVRRIPVVDARGRLVGILGVDDVLALLFEETRSVGRILERSAPLSVARR